LGLGRRQEEGGGDRGEGWGKKRGQAGMGAEPKGRGREGWSVEWERK